MKVLHVLAPARFGGLEAVVTALVTGQVRRSIEAHVAAVLDLSGRQPPLITTMAQRGVPLHLLARSGRDYLRQRRQLAALIVAERPHIVHTHGYHVDVLTAGLAHRLGAATVATVHGFTGGGPKNRLYEWLQMRALCRQDAVAAVSRPIRDRLVAAGVSSERVRLLPNAWVPEAPPHTPGTARLRLGVSNGSFHIGWVGRLSAEKDPETVLLAVSRLRDPSIQLSFLGDGPERQRLEARAAELGLVGSVRFHGVMADAASLYSAFDLFVLSSRTEGTPIVLFEAMAATVPIVATRVGGVPDVVTESEALLVPPGSAEALAEAIRVVRDSPVAAKERARRTQLRLRSAFAELPWLQAYEELYADVLSALAGHSLSAACS